MSGPDYRRVQELFLRARELDVEERVVLLDEACGDDGALRAEVASMLAFEAQAPEFLATPAVPPSTIVNALQSEAPAAERVAKLVGQSNTEKRFVLSGELAEGGMGKILEVFDTDLRRAVAMKVLRGQTGALPSGETPGVDAAMLTRFLEEAQVTGQLEHPGVVPVYELGVDAEGRVYFTMRRVRGQHLGRVFERVHAGESGWSRIRALGILQRVCETMAFAHQKGVVHRDLKPANIMVGDYGEVYVMDWGLAQVRGRPDQHDLRPAAEAQSAPPSAPMVATDRTSPESGSGSAFATLDGTVIGTPHYMPPEQAQGRVEELDERVDVYALGAMLYHLLAGAMPYAKAGQRLGAHEVLAAVKAGPPPGLLRVARDAPAELVAICEKAMARERARRYADMRSMAADLTAYLEGRVVHAHRTGAFVELSKWVRRNRALAGASVVAVGALGVGLFVAIRFGKREAAQRTIAEARTLEAERQAYRATVRQAFNELEELDLAETRRLLEEAPVEQRDWEWRYLSQHLELDESVETYGGFEAPVLFAGFLESTGEVFGIDQENSVRLWDRTTGRERVVRPVEATAGQGRSMPVALSPEGELVLGFVLPAEGRPIPVLWETATGAERRRFPAIPLGDWSPAGAVAPGGTHAAPSHQGNWTKIVRNFEVATGEQLFYRKVRPLSYSADGEWLLVDSDDAIRILDQDSGELLHRIETPTLAKSSALSPDRTLLATAHTNLLLIWDVSSGVLVQSLNRSGGAITFTPDGTALVELGDAIRFWSPRTGELVRTLRYGSGGTPGAYSFSGTLLATVDGAGRAVRVWDLTAESPWVLRGHESYVYPVALSPDGKTLASGSLDESVRLWDASSGASLGVLPFSSMSWDLAFDPLGGRLLCTTRDRLLCWDAATGRTLWESQEGGYALAYTPDGSVLLVGRYGKLAFRDGRSCELLEEHDVPGGGVVGLLAVSHDGTRIALGSKGTKTDGARKMSLWDSATRAPIAVRRPSVMFCALTFSPDGSRLLSGHRNGNVLVWDSRDLEGEPLLTLRGHRGEVFAIRYLNAQRIATAGRDGTIRIWHAETGQELALLEGHEDYVFSLAVSADGERLVSGSGDGTVRIWEALPPAERLRASRAAAAAPGQR